MPGELGPAHHWLLGYLDNNCTGLLRAQHWDEVLAAAEAAKIKSRAGIPMGKSAIRILKEEILESRRLICATQKDGVWRPVNWQEVLMDTREKWMRVSDLRHKAVLMEEVATEMFGPQILLPGMPPAAGEAAPKGYGVP